ncbi:MAG: DUF929 family protein [Actinomycetota bacterium]|jgi:hypothetical protein|nr:DUF929 family protein [Actinomycetota bacterium]
MAADNKPGSTKGGNTPKPGGTKGGNTPKPPSAKDASRQQSRNVTGTGATRPGRTGAAPRGVSGAVMAWGAVALVVVVVAVLVIVKVTGGSTTTTGNGAGPIPVTAAPASVVHDVTSIPTSVYNTVGITAPGSAGLNPPFALKGQPALSLGGHAPAILYYGAEYCPFCAATRWAVIAALSRFGTWSGLQITGSSPTDVYPDTRTFTFRSATYSSRYISFQSAEACTNIAGPASLGCNGYTVLQTPNKQEQAVLNKYALPPLDPYNTQGISFPYLDINNKVILSGTAYTPQILAGLTWQQIASVLSDPTNTVTQAIVAAANYLSAGICASTGQQPANVCTSAGVKAATKALKL